MSCSLALLLTVPLHGEERSNALSSAVDARGVRHQSNEYPARVLWKEDVIKMGTFDYPYELRSRRIGGSGLFRLTLDLNTGAVTKVQMIQSTRVASLDNSAMKGFRQMRWKPHKWKEIDLPITFTVRGGAPWTTPARR